MQNININGYKLKDFTCTIINSISNCKLCTIENIQTLNYYDKLNIDNIKNLLSNCRILVYFHTIDANLVKFFRDNFEIYSESKVPVGYGAGYQYHVILKNIYSKDGNKDNLRPVEKNTKIKDLEQILTSTLKAKRRKTDIV